MHKVFKCVSNYMKLISLTGTCVRFQIIVIRIQSTFVEVRMGRNQAVTDEVLNNIGHIC